MGLLKLGTVQIKSLHSDIEFQELTIAVQQLSFGGAPAIDGMPTQSYKCFCQALGTYEIFKWSFSVARLLTGFTRAVLLFLLK